MWSCDGSGVGVVDDGPGGDDGAGVASFPRGGEASRGALVEVGGALVVHAASSRIESKGFTACP